MAWTADLSFHAYFFPRTLADFTMIHWQNVHLAISNSQTVSMYTNCINSVYPDKKLISSICHFLIAEQCHIQYTAIKSTRPLPNKNQMQTSSVINSARSTLIIYSALLKTLNSHNLLLVAFFLLFTGLKQ